MRTHVMRIESPLYGHWHDGRVYRTLAAFRGDDAPHVWRAGVVDGVALSVLARTAFESHAGRSALGALLGAVPRSAFNARVMPFGDVGGGE